LAGSPCATARTFSRPSPSRQTLRSRADPSSEKKMSAATAAILDLGRAIPKAGQYRLYFATNCPFAHRPRMVRAVKGGLLDEAFLLSESCMGQTKQEGFFFDPPEAEFGKKFLREVYAAAKPGYEGKFSVPLLVDRDTKEFVNNESIELAIAMARMTEEAEPPLFAGKSEEEMAAFMDELSKKLTLGPYKYIFSTDAAVKEAVQAEFYAELSKWDAVLAGQDYVLGSDQFSLADCVMWPVLVRVDNVYARQFGLKGKTIREDFPNLQQYLQRIAERFPRLLAELDMPLLVRLYWQSGNLSPHCGNDPESPVPEVIDIFDGKLGAAP